MHVIPSIGPLRGGPSEVLPLLAAGLAAAGVQVHVTTTDDNGGTARLDVPLGKAVESLGVTYWYFPRQTAFYSCSWPLGRWLWRAVAQYDLLHIHGLFSYSSTVAAWIARAKRVPYLVRPLGHLNRWGMEHRRPLLKRLSFAVCERAILQNAAAVHYTSQQEQAEAELLGFRARPVIIPNPVSLGEPSAVAKGALRARYPQLRDRVVYLFLSRVDEKKGIPLLFSAFARVHAADPATALIIAGSGSPGYESSLRRLTVELHVEDHVLWLGFLRGQAKAEALADADVFVLPSYSENFGVALAEAMAAGLPVIVSDRVGIHPQVSSHGAGLVTDCAVDALAEAMTRLATADDLRREMGLRGRALALSQYSIDSVTARVIAAYEEIVGRGAA